jgi:hypothetical protein
MRGRAAAPRTVEQVDEAIADLRHRRRLFAHEHDGRLAGQGAERVEVLQEAARQVAAAGADQVIVAATLDGDGKRLGLPADPSSAVFDEIVKAFVISLPEFAAFLRSRVEANEQVFAGGMTSAEFAETMVDFDRQLEQLQAERQEVLRAEAHAQLDAELGVGAA